MRYRDMIREGFRKAIREFEEEQARERNEMDKLNNTSGIHDIPWDSEDEVWQQMEAMAKVKEIKAKSESLEESYLERSIEILEECGNLIRKKGQDYQGGTVTDPEYYPHGWQSFDTMLQTKLLRFRSVMEQEGKVNFDSADDCLRDLINYSARCIVWLEREKFKWKDV